LYWVKYAQMFLSLLFQQTHTHTHKDNYQNGILHHAITTHTTHYSKMPDTLLKVRQPSSSSFVILKSYKALHWGIWLGSGVTTCGEKLPFLFSVTLHAALTQPVHFICVVVKSFCFWYNTNKQHNTCDI